MDATFPVRAMAGLVAVLVAAACGNAAHEAFPAPAVFVATPVASAEAPPATAVDAVADAVADAVTDAVAGVAGRGARVVVFSPLYDSPGARVPIVVTVYHGPAKLPGEALDVTATGGGRVEECGISWRNPQTHGLSRACQLVLPARLGTVELTGRAVWRTPAGERQALRSPARSVEAKGPRSGAVGAAQAEAISRCGNTGEDVWLTFDDVVPSFEVAEGMVAVLARNRVRGRFFLNRIDPRVRRLLESRGHVVTNHTRDHLALTDLSRSQIAEQIRNGPATTPGTRRLIRPPYGAGAWSTRVVDAIDEAGHAPCRWTVDTRDWAGRTPAQMAAAVRWGDESSPPAFAGGVVLMHATAFAPAKLQAVIDAVKERGLVIEPA